MVRSYTLTLITLTGLAAIPKVKWIVPFEPNNSFTGRESELTTLEMLLFTEGGPKKIAVIGLGGVGKTSLIVELAYRIMKDHEDCSVFWIPATNFESLQQAYLSICTQLQLPGWDNRNEDPKTLLQRYLSQASAGQWLLVFDNADDIDMWTGSQGSNQVSSPLKDYLPSSQKGRIVFTSRDRKTAYSLVQRSQHIIEVPELSENVAIELLQKYVPKLDLGRHEDDTKSLLEKLTYLPLAIVQAASYINQNGESLATYLSLLACQEEEVIDLLSQHFEDDSRHRDVKNPVAMTWLISFEQIRVHDPLAAEFLSFIACVDSKDVPLSLLPPGLSRKEEISALGTLDAYAFVYKRQADSSLDVHRLVHLATRNWLRKENSLVRWTEIAVNRLDDVFPDQKHQNRSVWRRYLAHAQLALNSRLLDQEQKKRIDLAWKVGNCLDSDGRWMEAEALLIQVKDFRKKVLGEEHPDALTSMNNLASTFHNQGKYKEAESLYKETLQLMQKVCGDENPYTLVIRDKLALLFESQGKYKAAVEARSGRRAATEAGVISVGTPQRCIICMNMTGPKLGKTYKIINFYETASTGCPFCRLVCDLWDHAINADWRMLHENFQNRVALSWKDDGPAEIEFFYPFQDGPEYLDGEKNRVYAVANPSPGGCVYLLASTFISSVVLYIGRPCILILDRS